MGKLNDIIEWQEFGSEYRLYIRHHWGKEEKVTAKHAKYAKEESEPPPFAR